MIDPALQSYIDKWLAAHPAQHLGLSFLPPEHAEAYLAMAALELELVNAAFGIAEPQVATVKLNWWAEELSGAAISGGRHPLVQALFRDPRVRAIDPGKWLAPIGAALEQLGQGTPPDFEAQRQVTQRVLGGIAELETELWFGAAASSERAAQVATLNHLLYVASRLQEMLEADNLPLPMSRLAKHQLHREDLASDSPERRAAMREQLNDLLQAWRAARKLPGPLSNLRGLDERLGHYWLRKALASKTPLARLRRTQERQTGFTTLRYAWAAARRSRRAQH